MPTRVAYMPLPTYPEPVADNAVLAAAEFAAALGFDLHVSAFSVDIPHVHSPLLGGLLLDIPALARAAEEKSKAECLRLNSLLQGRAKLAGKIRYSSRQLVMDAALDVAPIEARYFDVSALPWSSEAVLGKEIVEAVVFGSGRPAILVPPSGSPVALEHIAIAWDESRVAARALCDALSILPDGGRVTVLTVHDDKALSDSDIAESLAYSLEQRGFKARACTFHLDGRTISEALQERAIMEDAQLLAMGGFGHSRLRDFVLGGATKGVLTDLRLPALLSH